MQWVGGTELAAVRVRPRYDDRRLHSIGSAANHDVSAESVPASVVPYLLYLERVLANSRIYGGDM